MAIDRKDWLTNLRGLAILAVVVGHMGIPYTRHIYAWHIPLFFALSGVTIDPKTGLWESTKKNFLKLIVPFVVFGLVGLIAEFAKRQIWPGFAFANTEFNYMKELWGILWWMDFAHLNHYGFVLWFLPALFWAKTIFIFLQKILKNEYIIAIISLGGLLVVKDLPTIPFGVDTGIMGLFWLATGRLMSGKFWWATLTSLMFLGLPLTNISTKLVSIYGIAYSLIVINSLIGIVKKFEKKLPLINSFGQSSLQILILHPYLNNVAYFLSIYILGGNWLMQLLLVVLALIIFVIFKDPVIMVLRYIWRNNRLYDVPLRVIRSGLIIGYQFFSHNKLLWQIGNGRKIWIYPGCVVSRMFLYTTIPDNEEIELLRSKISQRTVFLDIGANIGAYSVCLSDLTKKTYAFEASPESCRRCRENYKLNDLKASRVINIALGNKNGSVNFNDQGNASTTNHIDEKAGNITVKMLKLDDWLKQVKFSKDTDFVINMDVEGYEEVVLNGAKKLLASKKVKAIVFEEFDTKSSVFKILKENKFEIKKISTNNYYAQKI